MLQSEVKKELIGQYALGESDTGSADVQIAVLSARITALTEHLKTNRHDHNTRRALLRLTGRRRRLLTYVFKNDPERYRSLVARLGLRR
jgi:small subunit ribosomal protein S15